MVDENNVLAHFFHLFHAMCGKQDRNTTVAQPVDLFLDHIGVDRIQAGEGFVQDDEFRVMHDRGDKLDLLLHPFGEFFHLLVPPVQGFEPIEHDLAFPGGFLCRQAFELGEVDQVFANFHFLIQSPFLWEVPHLCGMGFIELFAVEIYISAIRSGDGGDNADGGCFSGAIWAEHAEDGAGFDIETDFIHSHEVAVAFGDFIEAEYWVHEGIKMGKKGERRNGGTAEGRNGRRAEWQKGGTAEG